MAWPKGRPRKPLTDQPQEIGTPVQSKRSWKMKASANWETMNPAADNPDRFYIDRSMIPEGMDLQWVTDTVYGQRMIQHRADFEKKGWTPVHQEDFDGRFDGMFMPKGDEGEINNGGQVLMARPLELSVRAKEEEKRRAKQQLAIKEAALRGGDIPGVSLETRHETVHNKVSRSWERIAVPTDD